MKSLLTFLLLLFAMHSFAQQAPATPLCYITAGPGFMPGQDHGSEFSAGLTFTFSKHWGGSILYRSASRYAVNLPSDYSGGWCFFGDCTPVDKIHSMSFHLVWERFFSTKLFRLGLEAGPSIVNYYEEQFGLNTATYTSSGMGFNLFTPDKYVHSAVLQKGYGLSVKGKVEFPYSLATGIECDLFANINSCSSLGGIELLFNLGKVRERLHPKGSAISSPR